MRAAPFVALLLVAGVASAQPRSVGASTTVEAVGERGTWVASQVSVGGQAGALGAGQVEAGRIDRFGDTAAFVGADLYPVLGRGVSGNARARWAPGAEITARLDLGASLTAAAGGGWEVTAGGRRMAFADQTVHLVSAGAAQYVGAWYLGAETAAVVDRAGVPLAGRVVARRLGADGGGPFGSFWEVSAGVGQEARVEAAGRTTIREVWTVGGRGQRPVAGLVLATGAVGYVADGDLSRAQVQAGVTVRW